MTNQHIIGTCMKKVVNIFNTIKILEKNYEKVNFLEKLIILT